jgi:hypothetical protein
MGDGQHVWAAAEWLLMIRNCFVREEASEGLILGSGIPRQWLDAGQRISFGPAPTAWGDVSLVIEPQGEEVEVHWTAQWRKQPPAVVVALPGLLPARVNGSEGTMRLSAREQCGAQTRDVCEPGTRL